MLWNLECPVGLSQREICAHFNEGNLAHVYMLTKPFLYRLRGTCFSLFFCFVLFVCLFLLGFFFFGGGGGGVC